MAGNTVGGVRSMVLKWKYWYELRHEEYDNPDLTTHRELL